MTPHRRGSQVGSAAALAVLVSGLGLGLITGVAAPAGADPGDPGGAPGHSHSEQSAPKESGSKAAGPKAAVSKEPGSKEPGSNQSPPKQSGPRQSRAERSSAAANDAGSTDTAPARTSRGRVDAEAPASSRADRYRRVERLAERVRGAADTPGARRAGVPADRAADRATEAATEATVPVPDTRTEPAEPQTVPAIADTPGSASPGSDTPITDTVLAVRAGGLRSVIANVEARGRDLLAHLAAAAPGPLPDRVQVPVVASAGAPEPGAGAPADQMVGDGSVLDVAETELTGTAAPTATAQSSAQQILGEQTLGERAAVVPAVALAVPTAQLRQLVADTRDRLEVVATTVSATATGVTTALRQGIDTLRHPQPVGPVNVAGSVLFSLLGAVLQIFSGPPVLPAGRTVTVRTSTLTLPDSGKTVRADWYFPDEVDEDTRLIYLQHGFMATGPMYSYTAAYLAETTNSIVVAPSMSSNLFAPDAEWIGGDPLQQDVAELFRDERPELSASAAAAGFDGQLPRDFVLVGHSLGGTLVMGAADKMDDDTLANLKGVVLLDPVDMDGAIPAGLQRLSGADYRPVLNISSERYTWNLDGLVGDELTAARPGEFTGVQLTGGRHIDALQGGNPILQVAEYVVAGFSEGRNVEAVKILAGQWITDMYAGEPTPSGAGPDGTIVIDTPRGTATAIDLRNRSTDTVTAMPWDPVAKVILDALFRYAVYQPGAANTVPAGLATITA